MARGLGNITKMDPAELKMLKTRIDIATAIMVALIAILVVRLWHLQIRKGTEYAQQSENNRTRIQYIAAPRGNVLDRNGEIIIANRPLFNVVWIREDSPSPDEVLKELAKILQLDMSVLLERIRAGADHPRYLPTRLKENIDWETLIAIENNAYRLPGVQVEVVPSRDYRYGEMASHLVGYLGEINQQELDADKSGTYMPGDLIGKGGIEKQFDRYLRGEKGQSFVEVDVRGFVQKRLKALEAVPGNDLQLTVDVNLQQAAEEAMADRAGAVVAMEVNTGRILAVSSLPALPLHEFSGGIPGEVWQRLLNDIKTPLINKPVQGQYPPGSTYKIVTALAGLTEKVITPDTAFFCSGSINFGNRSYGCWKKGGHGSVSLHRALAESCDVYFYQVGQRLGPDAIAHYAKSLGLGLKTGITMEHEKAGLIPTKEWKLKRFKEPWQDGETFSIAIGQGFDLATPLQICRMTAAIANGGTLYRPQFIAAVKDSTGAFVSQFKPIIDGTSLGSPRTMELIRDGLAGAVNDQHGTATAAKMQDIVVAGKTGTAQVVRMAQYKMTSESAVPYKYRDHAWFTCFAPFDKPQIAVTVLVEHGGHGGSAAAPVAKALLAKYFEMHPLTPPPQSETVQAESGQEQSTPPAAPTAGQTVNSSATPATAPPTATPPVKPATAPAAAPATRPAAAPTVKETTTPATTPTAAPLAKP
ncbi:MAG: penicillin-binding protein 2, partial [Thermodesulfobacteriota bacterium]